MAASHVSFQAAVPVIPVDDVAAARNFYCDVLGFTFGFEQGDYVGVHRDAVELHIDGYATDGIGTVSVRIGVDDPDPLHEVLDAKGAVDPAEPLETKPWGTRQFSVRDLCGNRITFFGLR